MPDARPRRITVAITGASGSVYGLELLRALRSLGGVESHLVISRAGLLTIRSETDMTRRDVEALADHVHSDKNVGATLASGSFQTSAMIVAPCSMKTLGCIAHGVGDSLITRSADVVLKERRRLVLVARETPLNLAHLRNMVSVTEMGGIVYPPVPAFYSRPTDIASVVRETVGRVMSLCGLDNGLFDEWSGLGTPQAQSQ